MSKGIAAVVGPNPDAPECRCGTLENFAQEPAVPIVFDPELNEYQIRGTDGAGRETRVMIYHCPFCGGRTPRSRRDELFMHITAAEHERLKGILQNLETLSDVLAALGPPDSDQRLGYSETATSKKGRSSTKLYRLLTYTGLSKVADVLVTVHPTERVGFGFRGKPIERKARPQPKRTLGKLRKRRA
jgi:hypothetical protein